MANVCVLWLQSNCSKMDLLIAEAAGPVYDMNHLTWEFSGWSSFPVCISSLFSYYEIKPKITWQEYKKTEKTMITDTAQHWGNKSVRLCSSLTSLSLSAEDSRESHSSRRWTLPDVTSLRSNHCVKKQRAHYTNIFFLSGWILEPEQDGRTEGGVTRADHEEAHGCLLCHMLTVMLHCFIPFSQFVYWDREKNATFKSETSQASLLTSSTTLAFFTISRSILTLEEKQIERHREENWSIPE